VDTLRNVLLNPNVGVLFMVPNVEETLRVNGRARLVRDADLLERLSVQGKPPVVALVVDIEEAFFQCAKAFKRSRLWSPESWPAREELPTLGAMIHDQVKLEGQSRADIEAAIEASYKRLY
jgi:uncharacterized protein